MGEYRYELIPGSNPRTWTPVWYDEPVKAVKKEKPTKVKAVKKEKPTKLKGKNWLLYTTASWSTALTSCKDFLRVKVYKCVILLKILMTRCLRLLNHLDK